MTEIINNQKRRKTLAQEYIYNGGKMYVCNGNNRLSTGCDSLIYIRKEDILKYVEFGLDMSPEAFYGFACPICGEITKIDINIFPESFKAYADKVYNEVQQLKMTKR